jgi:hypothetical protein
MTRSAAIGTSRGFPANAYGLIKNRAGLSLGRFSWRPIAVTFCVPLTPRPGSYAETCQAPDRKPWQGTVTTGATNEFPNWCCTQAP